MQPTSLYRHFDASGTLLYVGISKGAIARLQAHEGSSHWANQIARVTIARHPTRDAALAAERMAIRSEGPLHNIVHVVVTKPKAEKSPPKPRVDISALFDAMQREYNALSQGARDEMQAQADRMFA